MMSQRPQPRREYKDTVFRDLFGAEERKENALSLYNALNGTTYTDPEELEITTLDDVIYMGLRNDVSVLVGNDLSLWEHQSTYNPNMPLRGLKYFARLYAAHEEKHKLNEYGRVLVKVPAPHFVVFYVGESKRPHIEVLRFSDAYEGQGDIEVVATVINVTAKESWNLLQSCEALAGYVRLVELVRENKASGLPFDEAVDSAVQQCIDEGVLADYLTNRRSMVIDMFMDEYDEEKIEALFREEGRQEGLAEGRLEGLAEGRQEGRMTMLAQLVREGILGVQDAAIRADVSEEQMSALAASLDSTV
ncbi:MAG: hypothetical protein Q4A07_09555 [Coriobacteriales bacterium]|nr:hypothetical protein [Coriobacteriales bacterium]